MTQTATLQKLRPVEVLDKYGHCLELVPMDPNFENISVGLYVKDGVCTIWTFSRKPGVEARIEQIRDQLVALGGMEAIEGHDEPGALRVRGAARAGDQVPDEPGCGQGAGLRAAARRDVHQGLALTADHQGGGEPAG